MEKMTSFEMAILLLWFQQHMTADDRRELAKQLPRAYNRMVGQEVAIVTIVPPEVK